MQRARQAARVGILAPASFCQNLLSLPGVAYTPQLMEKEEPHEPSEARVFLSSLGQTAPVGLGAAVVYVGEVDQPLVGVVVVGAAV